MQDDDAATVETLTKYRTIFGDFVNRHEGRIVDSPTSSVESSSIESSIGTSPELTFAIQQQTGQGTGETIAHRALAIAAARNPSPNWGEVEAEITKSLSLAKKRSERPNIAITRFRNAELLQQMGDLPKSRENLDQAMAQFREMGMDWWTEQANGLRGRIDSGTEFVWFAPYVDGPPTAE